MTNDELFRKYVFDMTNNDTLTDTVCELNTSTLKENLEDDVDCNLDELFAQYLFKVAPSMELVSDICHIRDLIFGSGERTLDVDPTYQDATVETEARPKNQTIAWFQAVKPQGPDMAEQMRGMRQRMHDMKFNPVKAMEDDRRANMSELERLLYEMPEQNPFYDRF